jgi:PilZ domain
MPRNFAIRLRCPQGDCDSWVTLLNREESLEQILEQTWDFKCREHGSQNGVPQEAMEVAALDNPQPSPTPVSFAVPFPATPAKKTPRSSERISLRVPIVIYGFAGKGGAFHEDAETILVNDSGALVTLKAKLAIGDNVFLVHKSSSEEHEVRVVYLDAYSDRETRVGLAFKQPLADFWKRTRKEPRVPKTLRVVVRGKDPRGYPFAQSAYTVDLSEGGARLDGVGFLTTPGQTIEVRRFWRKARFRVVWVGQVGSSESNQVGVVRQSEKNIWRVELPKSAADPPQAPKPPKT